MMSILECRAFRVSSKLVLLLILLLLFRILAVIGLNHSFITLFVLLATDKTLVPEKSKLIEEKENRSYGIVDCSIDLKLFRYLPP